MPIKLTFSFSSLLLANLQHDDQFNSQYGLTQAGLEEYSRSYYEQNMMYNHQKQSSYAQSEGYHSYVSSSDSTSTPFLDRWEQFFSSIHDVRYSCYALSRAENVW